MATDNINTSNQSTNSTGSLTNLLERSPWGRLNEVTSTENVLEGFANATGENGTLTTGGGAGSGNPFTNFGNPNASGSPLTGGTNPWAAINTSGGSNTSSSVPSTSDVSSDVFSGGTGNFGGIDFESASQSQSFLSRVEIDQIVSSSLSEAGINLPLSGSADSFSGGTPSSTEVGNSDTESAPVTESVFPQQVLTDVNTSQPETTTIADTFGGVESTENNGGLTEATDFVTALSGNNAQSQISDFANLLRQYTGDTNADDSAVVEGFITAISSDNGFSNSSQGGTVFPQTSGSWTYVEADLNNFAEILNQSSAMGSIQLPQSAEDFSSRFLNDITVFRNTFQPLVDGSNQSAGSTPIA
jgi:hypothetical protein